MLETLLEPFQYGFMQRAFTITLIVAIPAALLSCYLVLKGWALMGDAISHAVLPGVVIAYIIGIPFAIGAFIAGLFCAIATGYLADNSRVKRDTIMGVVFSGMFALGLILYTSIDTDIHLDHILFGDMLGVNMSDISSTLIISLFVTFFVLVRWRDLLLQAFDNQHAKATGLSVRFLHYALLIMVSLIIVAALKAVGIILAIALLITPGAIAYLLVKKFETMLLVSIAIGLFASFFGIYLSFFFDSAPAPTIVLVMATFFILVFIYNSWKTAQIISAK
ncbi:MAG: metal ABC transporter permease [Nitratireductor sp.]